MIVHAYFLVIIYLYEILTCSSDSSLNVLTHPMGYFAVQKLILRGIYMFIYYPLTLSLLKSKLKLIKNRVSFKWRNNFVLHCSISEFFFFLHSNLSFQYIHMAMQIKILAMNQTVSILNEARAVFSIKHRQSRGKELSTIYAPLPSYPTPQHLHTQSIGKGLSTFVSFTLAPAPHPYPQHLYFLIPVQIDKHL